MRTRSVDPERVYRWKCGARSTQQRLNDSSETNMNVYRTFDGMEAVAKFDEETTETTENGGEN